MEMYLIGVEEKITIYQAQLLDVKTNKDYQAMLHEIEACRAERAALDEKILLETEESEKRHAAVRGLEETLERRRRETSQGQVRRDAETQELKGRADAREAGRRRLAAGVPAAARQPL